VQYINIEFDGGRRLRCDIAAIQELEQGTGKPLLQIVQDLQHVGIQTLITCLYVLLKHEEPSLNPTLVRKRLEKHIASKKPIAPLFKGVSDALEASGVFQNDDDVDDQDAARPPVPATKDA
jgi:hypothetical protein